MRSFPLILLGTAIVALLTSWVLWRDLLGPTALGPAKPPARLHASYAGEEGAAAPAVLKRRLPKAMVVRGPFREVIDLVRQSGNVFVNWRALNAAAVNGGALVSADLSELTLADALDRILPQVSTEPALAYDVDEDVITISTAEDLNRNVATRVYDARDLLPAGASAKGPANGGANAAAGDSLVARLTAAAAPGTWRVGTLNRAPPGKPGSVRLLSGQLIVTQTPSNQRQVVYRLAVFRWQRGLLRFGWRAMAVFAALFAPASLLLLPALRRRRRIARGLCPKCAYDLRASEGKCPECGTAIVRAPALPPTRRNSAVLSFPAVLALVAVAAGSLVASWFLWKDVLGPEPFGPKKPMVPRAVIATTQPAIGLDPLLMVKLPKPCDAEGSLAVVVDFLRDRTSLNIFVDWPDLQDGGVSRTTEISADLSGLTLAEALDRVLTQAGGNVTLAYTVEDGEIDIATLAGLTTNDHTRGYDVRDLVDPNQQPAAHAGELSRLMEEVKARVDPYSWASAGGSPLPSASVNRSRGRNSATIHPGHQYALAEILPGPRAGQFTVTQTASNLREIGHQLEQMRWGRRAAAFARRASLLLIAAVGLAAAVLLLSPLRRRRRAARGLCGECGYDLRASTDRCPECGSPATAG